MNHALRRRALLRAITASVIIVAGGAAGSGHAGAAQQADHATGIPPGTGVVSLGLERQLRDEIVVGRHFLRDQQAMPRVSVEVTTSADISARLTALGGVIRSNIAGRVFTAEVPPSRVNALSHLPGVITVYPEQHMRAQLDQSVPEIRANQAWALTTPSGTNVQGNHVIVGVVDSGIDYHNPDFQNPDGSTRIVAMWDQTKAGTPPQGFTFGTECSQAAIQNLSCGEKDTDGHGTHVAGTAAGNGRSSSPATEIGVAPQADIIVVRSASNFPRVEAAWSYIVRKAQALGEPVVINNSFGGSGTPHDGSSSTDQALARLVGPGRIFVASAGNEGSRGIHASQTVRQGQTTSMNFTLSGQSSGVDIATFSLAADDVSVSLTNLDTGQTWGPVYGNTSLDNQSTNDGRAKVSLDTGKYDTKHHETDVSIHSVSPDNIAGRYRIAYTGSKIASTGRVDGWIQEDGAAGFDQPDETDTIDEPADSPNMIAVANYATRVTWNGMDNQSHTACDFYICAPNGLSVGDIKASSSRGPTADGRQKPDIAAPGTMIISSLSGDAALCTRGSQDNCIDPAMVTPDGKNFIDSGTSMASPHVTGVVALMLQADPTLDPAAALDILRTTARHDSFTGDAAWTPTFGAGKVDALAAVQAALARAGSAPAATATPLPVATTVPVAAPVDFSAGPVQVHRKNAVTAPSIGRAVTGTKVYVYIAWTAKHVPDGQMPTYTYTALRGTHVQRTDTFKGSKPSYAPGKYWASFPMKVGPVGTYTITGRVTIGNVSRVASTSLKVVKR